MSSSKTKRQIGKQKQHVVSSASWNFPLDSYNYKIIGIGAIVIAIAYGLMSTAISDDPTQWNNPLAVTISPVLLAIGYCVIIPYGLLARKKETKEHKNES
jgi:hypothetical protein